jgi:hypothetical protein
MVTMHVTGKKQAVLRINYKNRDGDKLKRLKLISS